MSGSLESLPILLTLIFGTMTMSDNAQKAGLTLPNNKIEATPSFHAYLVAFASCKRITY